MEVLVVGGGGREHALVDKLSQSSEVSRIFVAPGNAGTGQIADNLPHLNPTMVPEIVSFAKNRKPDLTIVGSDDALAAGIVDEFESRNLLIFGPTRAAAEIESSKWFAKQVMRAAGVPTAQSEIFLDFSKAQQYLRGHELPVVIKADGPEQGKGVTICQTVEEAEIAVHSLLKARKPANIEEYLEGFEVSLHAITDGEDYRMFPVAKDHKTAHEDNQGPMTGGMGIIAPIEGIDLNELGKQLVEPTLSQLKDMSRPFTGIFYPGVMLTREGPKVFEFNSRFGDPEAQGYMRLLKGDLLKIIMDTLGGGLNNTHIEWSQEHVVSVTLASRGYPGKYDRCQAIEGIEQADQVKGVKVYHGGTARIAGETVVTGGRALHVTALGKSRGESKERAYRASELINFDGKQQRNDIGSHILAI